MRFIIKLFPEITIKSAPVRKRFVKQLQRNLAKQLQSLGPDIVVELGWDRLEVVASSLDDDTHLLAAQITTVLSRTPGIASFAPVKIIGFDSLEHLGQQLIPIWSMRLAGQTFCVRAKRQGQHDYGSMDVERVVGSVLNHGTEAAGVKLRNPDVTVLLEIKQNRSLQNRCYVLLDQQKGLGGFPLGSQDPALSLVSGGFDSTVASYLTIKRGLLTHFCFFNLGGRAHELGVKEVSYYLWSKYSASHSVQFITVPFEEVVSEILQNVHNSQMGVVLKRMMLRVASRIAADLKIQALVTGESVAQVSSQTLANLSVIDSVTDTLVLRPLITSDKGDIIDLARQIGTEEFAANMPEYCGVISVKPTTRSTEERIVKEEASFDFEKLNQAYDQRRQVSITDVEKDNGPGVEVPVVTGFPTASLSSTTVVIDIRHPDEEERKPLSLAGVTLKKIPFFELSRAFPQLDSSTQHLLYCDKGVMSQLHAAHLMESGFPNVGVYDPA